MSESNGTVTAIVPMSSKAGTDLYRASTDAAGACKQIVTATAMTIQGRRYVKVEGWQSIAIAHGCFASSGTVERVTEEGGSGYRATGYVRRADTGAILAEAEGFVGDDEPGWVKRPVYARRAMAQTRAISRACRSAFAHVVVMMGAGLETTPAEEVPAEGFDGSSANGPSELEKKLEASVEQAKAKKAVKAAAEVLEGEIVDEFVIPIGKEKGKPLSEASPSTLKWLAGVMAENIQNPDKAKYAEKTARELKLVKAELQRRSEG